MSSFLFELISSFPKQHLHCVKDVWLYNSLVRIFSKELVTFAVVASFLKGDIIFSIAFLKQAVPVISLVSENVRDDAADALATIAADVKHGGMGTFVEILDICLEAAEGGQITGDILASARKYKLMY